MKIPGQLSVQINISAFILSFWLSRGMLRLPIPLRSLPRLILAHVLAGLVLYLFVGLLKSYFVTFAFDQARVVLFTQALWLAIDLGITGARYAAGSQTR